MVVSCPKCKARYKVDPAKIGETGSKIKCNKCGTMFLVKKPKKTQGPVNRQKTTRAPVPKPDEPKEASGWRTGSELFDEATRIADPKLMAALGKAGLEDNGEVPGPGQQGKADKKPVEEYADDLFSFGDLSMGPEEVHISEPGKIEGPKDIEPPEFSDNGKRGLGIEDPFDKIDAKADVPSFEPLEKKGGKGESAGMPLEGDIFDALEPTLDEVPMDTGSEESKGPAIKDDDFFADLDLNLVSGEGTFDASGEGKSEGKSEEKAPENQEEKPAGQAPPTSDTGPGPGDSAELARDLFADLSQIPDKVESNIPKTSQDSIQPAENRKADAFDFDNIDFGEMTGSPADSTGATEAEDIFSSGQPNLDTAFELGEVAHSPVEPAFSQSTGSGLAPKPDRTQSIMFYTASEDNQKKERDVYGFLLATVGVIAIVVLVGTLVLAGDRVDFSSLTPEWLMGEKTLTGKQQINVRDTRAYAYDNASGRHLLVVEGNVVNTGDKEIQVPGIKASIFDKAGRLLYTRPARLGCKVTPEKLYRLGRETDLDGFCSQGQAGLSPDSSKNFVVIFFDGPEHLSKYSYSVYIDHKGRG
ncbi:MAG: DUF3426 domain-containing protein [Deltaproteobacteria bacterium]|nr:DUF3426 domain-containing protein [Deltaproteobacteria bacterium]